MSANDGGPAIRVSRAPVDRPAIERGEMFFSAGEEENPSTLRVGDRIWATKTVERNGRRHEVTYQGAEVIERVDDDRACGVRVFVGPEVVVTWDPA